ncbi:MAG TPA: hypothetical protein VFZ59_27940 [Verrucomicrobiae bacterium]|nr:hypothetical protein [Verrucomicrobiae bacterium]
MKPGISCIAKLCIIGIKLGLFAVWQTQAQTTAFNFQGRLSNLGLPVNGYHDFRFSVYGSQAGADLISGPITVSPVAVKSGIFNCRLDFGESVFNGSARWLDISVRPTGTSTYTNLSPRVELTSAPYAVRAKEAAVAASVVNGAAVKSVNNLKDNVNLAAGPNVTLTTNGNTLTIGSTGGGGGGWSTLGTNTFYNTGNVGVGTTQPQGLMDINSGGTDRSALYVRADPSAVGRGGIIHHQSSTYGWQEVAQGTGLETGGSLAFHYVHRTAPGTKVASNVMTLRADGKVGLGTDAPTSRLEISGSQDALKITGYQPLMTLQDAGSGNARGVIQSVAGGLNFFSEQYLIGSSPSGFMRLHDTGNVGIGTAVPASKLDVRGGLTLETGGNATLYTGTVGAEQNRYLTLLNSPTAPSPSGLKAGGVLVADSYSYGNPGKNELIVKGNVTAGGDAIQSREKGGWVKAMALVRADGTIERQYCANGGQITVLRYDQHSYPSSYQVIFPFQVDDRFVVVTPFLPGSYHAVTANIAFTDLSYSVLVDFTGFKITVGLEVGEVGIHVSRYFTIVVY